MQETCVCCGGKLNDTMVTGLGRCQTCGHYSIYEPIGTEKYDESYLHKYDEYEKTDLGRRINSSRWALVSRHLQGHRRILDWGCGNGAFARSSFNGYYVAGYDINPHSPFSDPALYRMSWDGVTMWDVIEHMVDPNRFLKGMKSEYLFVVTPDADSAPEDFASWKHYRPDEHQHYFTIPSLIGILERNGFALKEINRNEAKIRDKGHPNALVTVVGRRY